MVQGPTEDGSNSYQLKVSIVDEILIFFSWVTYPADESTKLNLFAETEHENKRKCFPCEIIAGLPTEDNRAPAIQFKCINHQLIRTSPTNSHQKRVFLL